MSGDFTNGLYMMEWYPIGPLTVMCFEHNSVTHVSAKDYIQAS
jgi:hypothetical protein